jgi:alcohol dehydrogenase
MVKRVLHALFVAVAGFVSRFLPDKVPVTFVGSGSVEELCESIGQQSVRRPLVVTDATLVELGIVGRVTAALASADVDATVFDGVEPDPTFAQVEAGHAHYLAERCDGVIAVGGGSSIDAAKMIAAMATNGGQLDKLEGKMRVRKPTAPLFAIPTTAGTGSEVTIAAVVSDPDSHSKNFFLDPKLLPRMVALDPSLMTGLPAPITAATGMDALTHAVESYISKTANRQTRDYATTAVGLIFENLPVVYRDGSNLEARKAMALASYYAGLAFTRTSVGYVHAIAHNLGAFYRTPHGLANAIALPHVLEFSRDAATSQLSELGELIDVEGTSEAERADAFIAAVRELMGTIGIPETLDSLESADIPALAEAALAEAFLDYPVPLWMERDECEDLLRKLQPSP